MNRNSNDTALNPNVGNGNDLNELELENIALKVFLIWKISSIYIYY
jgi:hypothetical protein